MTEYIKLKVIKSEVVSAAHHCSILDEKEFLFVRSRLVNISAGYVDFFIYSNKSSKNNLIEIPTDQTTMNCKLYVKKNTLDTMIQKLQRSRLIKIMIETHLDTELVISDRGDLIIEEGILASVEKCTFIQSFT